MRNRILAIMLMSFIWLAGCAHNRYEPVQPQDYPYSMKIFDVTFGWKSAVSDKGLTVEGYARNNRYPVIRDLELKLELLASDGSVKSRKVYFFIPIDLPIDTLSSFSVTLAEKPQPDDRLRFLYRYRAVEGHDRKFDWVNSFEVPATPPAP